MNPKGHRARLAKTIVATSVLAAGSLSIGAAPAQAATATTFCFAWSNGPAYVNLPVTLEQWDGFRWLPLRNGTSGPNGCNVFSYTPGNATLRVSAVYWASPYGFGANPYGTEVFCGATPQITGPGFGTAFLGTGIVSRCA